MTNRLELVALAQEVRSEERSGANTAERVGRVFEELATKSVLLSTQETDLYIDGNSGSDTNDGTAGNPVRTIARLMEILGPRLTHTVWCHFEPADTPYDLDALIDLPEILRWLVFDGGNHHEQVLAPVPVSSHTGRRLEVSGTSWADDAYVSLHAELIQPGGAILGYGKIGLNDAGSLELLAAKENDLGAGGSVRVVRPAVKFRSSSQVGRGSTGPLPVVIRGGPRRQQSGRSMGGLVWRNIEIVADSGDYPSQIFTGSHVFIGCINAQSNGYGAIMRFVDASVWSGAWENELLYINQDLGITPDEQVGWGLSLYDDTQNVRRGIVRCLSTNFTGSICASVIEAAQAGIIELRGGFRLSGGNGFRNEKGVDQYYTFAGIAADASELHVRNEAGAGNGDDLMMIGGENLHAFYVGSGSNLTIDSGAVVQYNGTGGWFVLARNGGFAYLWDMIATNTAGGEVNILVTYDGDIRLTSGNGTDFAWIDNAYAGIRQLVHRTGPWATHDSIYDGVPHEDMPYDGGRIYRTS